MGQALASKEGEMLILGNAARGGKQVGDSSTRVTHAVMEVSVATVAPEEEHPAGGGGR